jgi:hypothetical protein
MLILFRSVIKNTPLWHEKIPIARPGKRYSFISVILYNEQGASSRKTPEKISTKFAETGRKFLCMPRGV